MNPLDFLGKFVVGIIHEGHLQAWIKLGVSLVVTGFVTFFGTFGLTGLSLISSQTNYTLIFVISLLTACLHMSIAILMLFKTSPLTKDIPVLYFGKIEAKRLEILSTQGSVLDINKR